MSTDMHTVVLLQLPNEVLFHVIEYLSTEDLLNVSNTCKKLSELVDVKRIRYVHLKSAFNCTNNTLRDFLKPEAHYSKIEVLELTSCYWLTASEINSCVSKLPELHSLYVIDTQFTFGHLDKVLQKTSKLKRIAISAYSDSLTTPSLSTYAPLCALTFLHVSLTIKHALSSRDCKPYRKTYYDRMMLNHLYDWLMFCANLEELWITSRHFEGSAGTDQELDRTFIRLPVELPKLHSLIIDVVCSRYLLTGFLNALSLLLVSKIEWRKWWINCDMKYHCDRLFQISNNCKILSTNAISAISCRDSPQVTHLMTSSRVQVDGSLESPCPSLTHLVLNKIADLCNLYPQLSQLQSLCLYSPPPSPVLDDILRNISKLRNLRSLSLIDSSACCWTNTCVPIASLTEEGICRVMPTIVKGCPLVSEFVLAAAKSKVMRAHRLRADNENLPTTPQVLPILVGWTRLTKLHLSYIQVLALDVIKVAESCPDMTSVRFQGCFGIVLPAQTVIQLCKALSLWNKLKDFRLEQDGIQDLTTLWETFSSLDSLERVTVVDESTTRAALQNQDSSVIAKWLRSSSKMVFFYFRCYVCTDVWKQSAARKVKNLLKQRRALRVMFASSVDSERHIKEISRIPLGHVNDMVELDPMKDLNILLPNLKYPVEIC